MRTIIKADMDTQEKEVEIEFSNDELDNMNFVEFYVKKEVDSETFEVDSETFLVSVEDIHMALLPFIELQKRAKKEINKE